MKTSYAKCELVVGWLTVAGLLCGAGQGCSGGSKGNPNGRPVSGTVTYQGSPVEGAYVSFISVTDSAFGQTDAQGKYKLSNAGGDRIPQGDYQVSIVKKETPPPGTGPELDPENPEQYVPPDPNAPPPPEPKDLLPVQYGNAASSGLTASVTADGKNEFDFALAD